MLALLTRNLVVITRRVGAAFLGIIFAILIALGFVAVFGPAAATVAQSPTS
jgi:ABC-type transport system involved in cytochrome c biogenesis permease component